MVQPIAEHPLARVRDDVRRNKNFKAFRLYLARPLFLTWNKTRVCASFILRSQSPSFTSDFKNTDAIISHLCASTACSPCNISQGKPQVVRISIHSTFLRSLSQHKKSRCSKIQGLRVLHRYGGSACWVSRRGALSLRVLSHRKEWQLSKIRIRRRLSVRLLALCLVWFWMEISSYLVYHYFGGSLLPCPCAKLSLSTDHFCSRNIKRFSTAMISRFSVEILATQCIV